MRTAAATLWRHPLLLGVLLAVLLAAPTRGAAHTKSETHTVWQITGDTVHLTFTLPLVEAQRLAVPGGGPPTNERLATYLRDHESVTRGAAACPLAAAVRPVAATEQFRRFELTFQCPPSGPIALHSTAFFELVPSHLTLAQIETDRGDFIEQLFTRDHQTVVASGESGNPLESAGFLEYVKLGVLHIFTGVDHMSFLLGLVLISRRMRDLAFVITGFTLGHSATLALAVTGIIRPHAEFIDALVALTIALIGAENVVVATHRPRPIAASVGAALLAMACAHLAGWGALPTALLLGAGLFSACYLMISGQLHDAGRLRLVVTLVFGLIHGFGFASDLLEMRLPAGRLAELLVGFNLGVEIGQLTLVFALLAVVAVLVRLRLSLPRPLVTDVVSAGLVGLGTFWFVSRSFR